MIIVSETLGLDPDYEKIVDWDHLAEPEDLAVQPSTYDFEYGDEKLPDIEQEKIDDINKKLNDLMWQIPQNRQDIISKIQLIKQYDIDYEEMMGSLSHNQRDILSSGISRDVKIKYLTVDNNTFKRGGNPYKTLDIGRDRSETKMTVAQAEELINDYDYIVVGKESDEEELKDLELAQEELIKEEADLENKKEEIFKESTHLVLSDKYEAKIKELQELKDNSEIAEEQKILDKRIKGYEWKIQDSEPIEESYILFNNPDKEYLVEALGDYEQEEAEHEKMADESLIFYIRLNTEVPALVKVYKAGDIDDRWELTVVEGDNTALDEMEFDPEFSKMEIITYLTDIYEDIEEVDDEFMNDVIDDKEEIDSDFYGMDESLSNFQQGLDPYKTMKVGQYHEYEEKIDGDSIDDADKVKHEMKSIGRIKFLEVISNDFDGIGHCTVTYIAHGYENSDELGYRYEYKYNEETDKILLRYEYENIDESFEVETTINHGENIIAIIFSEIKKNL